MNLKGSLKLLIKYSEETFSSNRKTSLTIGEFDGFHRGHMKIIKRTLKMARQTGSLSAAVTFQRGYPSLFSLKEKLYMFGKAGFDIAVIFRKGGEWRNWNPRFFTEKFLFKKMSAKNIIVGEDFRFGKKREGSIKTLRELESRGVETHICETEKADGKKISSSLIRDLITKGEIKSYRLFCGRNYFFRANIIKGKQLGRKLGFPTVNFSVPPEKLLPQGVFFCRGLLGEGKEDYLPGACFLRAPTDSGAAVAEVHFIDYRPELKKDLAGAEILKKISTIKKIDSLEMLSEKIARDVKKAKELAGSFN